MSFDALGLTPELVRAVADQGYEHPTPVQREAIPFVLAGRDLLAGAQTGTGKTAAFVLPIIQHLHATRRPFDPREKRRQPVRVLVLTPTRELAIQVEQSVRTYGAHRPVRSMTIFGGVPYGPQIKAIRAGAEVVVATPGRLLDHLDQRALDLSTVEVLVLDEADRMLDMGFIHDIRRVLAVLPPRRQNLLFSATFSDEIRRLADGLLDQPASVQVTPRNSSAELVRQVVHPVDRQRKRALLSHLVRSGRIDHALVFTRTKHGADRLAEQLFRDGIAAAAIHGNKSQSQRIRALNDFKARRVSVLVATDIAARGLDIDALPHVVNFELPNVPEDYIHRIGRTGRAGMEGDAVSLVGADEAPLLWAIVDLLGRPIATEPIDGFAPGEPLPPRPVRHGPTGKRTDGSRRSGGRRPGPRGWAPGDQHRPGGAIPHAAGVGRPAGGPRHDGGPRQGGRTSGGGSHPGHKGDPRRAADPRWAGRPDRDRDRRPQDGAPRWVAERDHRDRRDPRGFGWSSDGVAGPARRSPTGSRPPKDRTRAQGSMTVMPGERIARHDPEPRS
ncbi:MAG TPA: DEAD/DEAH box helicase [Candidatus Limnocylindrales bacterium]|nr:DEAD/DEAH box helicase [Candidatus Limnocylindrales bacterium]